MEILIDLSPEEKEEAEKYCEAHGISIEEAMKKAFFEVLEEQFGLTLDK